MNFTLNPKTFQRLTALASITMALITSVVSNVHLPVVGSATLGIFGILLHPETSITSTTESPSAGP